jgi:glycosyltransferase involved in cell wall biosynthesis
MLATAVSKRSLPILSALKKIRNPSFDWVIAHNPGAFYPAYYFAKKNKIKLGIDVEDYHPGESHDPGEIKRMKKLMQYVLPKSSYCSFASPLIKEMVETDITPAIPHKFVLLNGFPQDEFELQVEKKSGPLQCVWFSQFIDSHRGLENVIPVIDNFYPDIELHLAGNLVESFADKLLQNKKGIVYHGSLTQKELHMLLCRCDIGLAVEPGRDVNNQLAISNKLMAYAQAGLFIVASRTPAQDEFLSSSSLDYLQTDLSETDLKKQLQRLILNKEQLRETRKERFEKGKSYSWEKSSPALIKLWQQV